MDNLKPGDRVELKVAANLVWGKKVIRIFDPGVQGTVQGYTEDGMIRVFFDGARWPFKVELEDVVPANLYPPQGTTLH